MFIKGKCAIYIDKNLRVYENSTGIFVLWYICRPNEMILEGNENEWLYNL